MLLNQRVNRDRKGGGEGEQSLDFVFTLKILFLVQNTRCFLLPSQNLTEIRGERSKHNKTIGALK